MARAVDGDEYAVHVACLEVGRGREPRHQDELVHRRSVREGLPRVDAVQLVAPPPLLLGLVRADAVLGVHPTEIFRSLMV